MKTHKQIQVAVIQHCHYQGRLSITDDIDAYIAGYYQAIEDIKTDMESHKTQDEIHYAFAQSSQLMDDYEFRIKHFKDE
jgi:hypothetical protein